MNTLPNKKLLAAIILVTLIGAGVAGTTLMRTTSKQADPRANSIKSFDDCAKAGYPVVKSEPSTSRCTTPEGVSFTKQSVSTKSTEGQTGGQQRICPDAWYDNKMPTPEQDSDVPTQYFVVDGKRVELESLDVAWVRSNCPVNKPETVY